MTELIAQKKELTRTVELIVYTPFQKGMSIGRTVFVTNFAIAFYFLFFLCNSAVTVASPMCEHVQHFQ